MKPTKKLLSIFLLLMMLSGCGQKTGMASSGEAAESAAAASEQADVPPEEITATLMVAGDIMSHMPLTNTAYRQSTDSYDYTGILREVRPYLEQADYAVGNLETTLWREGPYSGYPQFRSPAGLATSLRDIGFDLLATANNHCMDKRFDGLTATLDILDEAGLAHVGTYRTTAERAKQNGIYLADVGGISVAFLSYTYGTNGIPVPADKDFSVNLFNTDYMTTLNTMDTALLTQNLQAAKALKPDLIAVIMHWGVEYQTKQNPYQEKVAQFLREQGADLILGSHSHVLQPYVWDNKGFICYSTGNFLSTQKDEYTDTTVLYQLTLSKKEGQAKVSGVQYIPFYMRKRERGAEDRYLLMDVEKGMTAYTAGTDQSIRAGEYAGLEKALQNCQKILGE